MDRVYQSSVSGTPPAAPSVPLLGFPRAGDPISGTKATRPGPWWFHMITEELRNIVVAGGVSPDGTDTDQVLQALQSLFVSSSQANSRPGHVYGGADWCWLDRARGLALQWGYIDINGSGSRTQNITLPLTFQTNFLRSWAIDVGAACVSISSIPISGSQLRLFVPSGQIGTSNTVTTTGPIGVQWFALGVF